MTFNLEQSSAPYASFWQRAIAALIDGVILSIINSLVSGVLKLSTSTMDLKEIIVQCLIGLMISWIYYSTQESSSKRATLGKRVMGLQVTDLNGARISFWRSTARYFSTLLSALPLFIGYLMVLFNPKRQALHDLIAGTLVMRLSSRA